MPLAELAESVWYGEGLAARSARSLLVPASAAYGGVVARINARHDAAPPAPGAIPAMSIGNLTVGGTGKTPVCAWFARQFVRAGAMPAIVLRGYGDDEVHVHRLLNPDVPVLLGIDRTSQVALAARRGADVALLDDAFQHRRAARVADVVLVSADRWNGRTRLLPAGPFREPMASLHRATLVLVTVKAAPQEQVQRAVQAARGVTAAPVLTVELQAGRLVPVGAECASPPVSGARVLAVSGIGDPVALHAQLYRLGLEVTPLLYADHHAYDAADVRRIVREARGTAGVICTLKDAVKLEKYWQGSVVPLWYLSQTVVPRDGAAVLDASIQSVLAARRGDPFFPDLSR